MNNKKNVKPNQQVPQNQNAEKACGLQNTEKKQNEKREKQE